jgi:hypothetical protein
MESKEEGEKNEIRQKMKERRKKEISKKRGKKERIYRERNRAK